MLDIINKIVSPSLSSAISKQISIINGKGYDFEDTIYCHISNKYIYAQIVSAMYSVMPSRISASPNYDFYKKSVKSIEDAINKLTSEVSNASLIHNQFRFIHSFNMQKDDASYYIKNKTNISLQEKAEMIKMGNIFRSRPDRIQEIYTAGSWEILKHQSWSDMYLDVDTEG